MEDNCANLVNDLVNDAEQDSVSSETGHSEEPKMPKTKVHVLNVEDGEVKIPENDNSVSVEITDKETEELFLLNVENEIKAYSISNAGWTESPGTEVDFLANLENEIAAHAIPRGYLHKENKQINNNRHHKVKEKVDENKKEVRNGTSKPRKNQIIKDINPIHRTKRKPDQKQASTHNTLGVNAKLEENKVNSRNLVQEISSDTNAVKKSSKVALMKKRLWASSRQNCSQNPSVAQESPNHEPGEKRKGRYNGESGSLKRKRHKVVGNLNRDVYEGLEYLLEDEEIVLQNVRLENYITADHSTGRKNTKEEYYNSTESDSSIEFTGKLIPRKKRITCKKNKTNPVTQELDNLLGTLPPQNVSKAKDIFQFLWDTIAKFVLPSSLWSVHRDPNKQFIAFSHISPESSNIEFITDKVVIVENSSNTVVFLRGIKVDLPNISLNLESVECVSSILQCVDRIVLCIGFELQKHSDSCKIYINEGEKTYQCKECALEGKCVPLVRRKKLKKESLHS